MSHAKLKRFRLGRSLLGGVLTISGLVGIAVLAAPPATASSLIYQLDPGDRLSPGTVIASENGLYQLKMADNGNVLLRYSDGFIIGDTNTYNHAGSVLFMQRDGNLVLRAPGNVPIWASGTSGHPGAVVQIQNDGALMLYAPGHRFLKAVFPPDRGNYSVPTPRFGQVAAVPAPGVSDPSEVGVAVWDGTRVLGCATAGKLVELGGGNAVASITEEQACGMITAGKAPEVDGYNAVRLSGSVAAGLAIGGPWGAALGGAWDILTDASPAY